MNLDEIRELIHLMKENGITEVDIEHNGERVHLKADAPEIAAPQQPAPQSVHVYAPHPGVPLAPMPTAPAALPAPGDPNALHAGHIPEAPTPEHDPGVVITSPIVGLFYSSPAPDKPPFVEVGTHIDESSVLCIIEAMKVMNEIKAETSGTVREVLVTNGQSVEYGQPLFVVDPA